MPWLTNLADIARRTGFPVVEQPGWKNRGHGAMSAVRAVICHHDAAKQSPTTFNSVVQNGRAGLPGPLSQFTIRRDGTIHVVAAGLSYHAGATINNSLYSNSYSVGIEAGNDGVGEPWPRRQLDAYESLCAELCKAFGLGVDRVRGHKEIAAPLGRKPDPRGIDMNAFRAAVANRMKGGGGGSAPPSQPEINYDLLLLEDAVKEVYVSGEVTHDDLNVDPHAIHVTIGLPGLPGTRLVVNRAWEGFTVHEVKTYGLPGGGGITWKNWTTGAQKCDPARPFSLPLDENAVSAELILSGPVSPQKAHPVVISVVKD